ncbi:hypothetical protein KSC_026880 [Ktedonobacter sp. SOSP1-52]|nr:hypothetical protein KSC_026880 [Ktedonobacter sp. SOSP1-52]
MLSGGERSAGGEGASGGWSIEDQGVNWAKDLFNRLYHCLYLLLVCHISLDSDRSASRLLNGRDNLLRRSLVVMVVDPDPGTRASKQKSSSGSYAPASSGD